MSSNLPVRRIAIVGTGVIGEAWAAYCLPRGLAVIQYGELLYSRSSAC